MQNKSNPSTHYTKSSLSKYKFYDLDKLFINKFNHKRVHSQDGCRGYFV